jgi:uncharacterized repeat protein (TIGR03803 family)
MNIATVLIGRVSCILALVGLGFGVGMARGQTIRANAPSVKFTVLHTFVGVDGQNPQAPLIQAIDGNLYGTTTNGGTNCTVAPVCGTAFKIAPKGSFATVYNFCSQPGCEDGGDVHAPLVQATNGDLYGATSFGGGPPLNDVGTVFKLTPSGTLTNLYDFCSQIGCSDGATPLGGMVQAANGDIYGTTGYGGGSVQSGFPNGGTIFKLTPNGTLTTLYEFCSTSCADGELPMSQLVQGLNGKLYGTTSQGGIQNANCYGTTCGTIFEITPSGMLTTLHQFCSETGCTDGSFPGGLVAAPNGDLHGTTLYGGLTGTSCSVGGCGTIFRITPSGTFSTVYSFCSQSGCPDGSSPSGLVLASSGDLYGLAAGGANNEGIVFRLSLAGGLTTLYSFCSQTGCSDGAGPTSLIQGTDGVFYGITYSGGGSTNCGPHGCGTMFSLSTGEPPFVTTRPTIGIVGEVVTIIGYGLKGATSVTFNGTPATILYDAATVIYAKVPSGATTGKVEVVTSSGTLTSNVGFEVAP